MLDDGVFFCATHAICLFFNLTVAGVYEYQQGKTDFFLQIKGILHLSIVLKN
jgi:hypothetical protein